MSEALKDWKALKMDDVSLGTVVRVGDRMSIDLEFALEELRLLKESLAKYNKLYRIKQ